MSNVTMLKTSSMQWWGGMRVMQVALHDEWVVERGVPKLNEMTFQSAKLQCGVGFVKW
jgi:hypothetical protein